MSGIAPGVARIAHSFAVCFLYPLVHFILVLIESVAAKDIAPGNMNGNLRLIAAAIARDVAQAR